MVTVTSYASRARWYREHTCKELTGSLEEQNEQWDNYMHKRNFRARGDTAPLERRYVCQPLWDDLQFSVYVSLSQCTYF